MSKKMQVEVIAPNKVVAKVEAGRVNVAAHWGYLTILPQHAPFITELSVGGLTVGDIAGKPDQKYFISGGFLQVANDRLVILADVVEKPNEIDRARAQKALDRAKERLAKAAVGEQIDYERANRAMGRAVKRLEYVEMINDIGNNHPS